ncbi:MAG: anti-sigma factor antagonist, partial [Planctomycetes bacterium]|nr:anti-sigma factor antagonist [Planctomycetota bacterium]
MPAPGSPLHVNATEGVTVVTFRDRILLDTEELKLIEAELIKMLDGQPGFKLVIDFNKVQTLSSQMLGTLLKVSEA